MSLWLKCSRNFFSCQMLEKIPRIAQLNSTAPRTLARPAGDIALVFRRWKHPRRTPRCQAPTLLITRGDTDNDNRCAAREILPRRRSGNARFVSNGAITIRPGRKTRREPFISNKRALCLRHVDAVSRRCAFLHFFFLFLILTQVSLFYKNSKIAL